MTNNEICHVPPQVKQTSRFNRKKEEDGRGVGMEVGFTDGVILSWWYVIWRTSLCLSYVIGGARVKNRMCDL